MSLIEAPGMSAATSYVESGGVSISCRHSPQPALVVRSRVAHDQVAPYLREAFARLRRGLGRRESPVPSPFIAYHELTASDVDIEVGLPIGDPTVGADEPPTLGCVPMGRYAGVRRPLGAEPLPQVYRTLRDWLSQHSEHAAGPVYMTLEAGGPTSVQLLVQRKICAGSCMPDEDAKTSLLYEDGSQITRMVLAELERDATGRAETASALAVPLQYLHKLHHGVAVRDVMTESVVTCTRSDSLTTVAQRMWEHDIGALPVVGRRGGPIAVITDRDVCMAAYTQGKPLTEIPVASVMSRALFVCNSEDSLLLAEETMAAHQVRRLPVVDTHGALVGIVSLNDIVRACTRGRFSVWMERVFGRVATTYAAISQRRRGTRAGSS